ncbi:MAG: hypothetical protein SWK76_02785 [Actinomycetota bacterium]|nr:hypothetical protein [Actinomycetota bacterium]
MRLAAAFSIFGLTVIILLGFGLYFLYSALDYGYNHWRILLLFWLGYIPYAVLRYALSYHWVFK